MQDYGDFIRQRAYSAKLDGFEPVWLPDSLFPFQRHLVEWSIRLGRSAIFADCGLGKSLMELVWAENVARKTDGRVLILTPIAVGQQMVEEGEKFGIEAFRSRDGQMNGRIIVTNYEQLHQFNPRDFKGVVGDESSCIKDAKTQTRDSVTRFFQKVPYRLMATATAAPNDYHELGTTSEALGYLGYQDMLTKFFKLTQNEKFLVTSWARQMKYRFRQHAITPFWRWVVAWARACRKPQDLGFDDNRFELPRLLINQHIVEASRNCPGFLWPQEAVTLQEQRDERKATTRERCEKVAELMNGKECGVAWGHNDDECNLMEKLIDGAVQVSGRDKSIADREAKFTAFRRGDARVMVIKPKIGAWGLNWQHCNYMTTFPSHSYEQFYQAYRRLYRFGQKRDVTIDIVTTQGEISVLENLTDKSARADQMFDSLVQEMNNPEHFVDDTFEKDQEIPQWL